MHYVVFVFACLIEATITVVTANVPSIPSINASISILSQSPPKPPNAGKCPPNFYGPKCEIPYCQPGNGYLVQLAVDKYFCNCTNTMYIAGTRCETVTCRFGEVYNETHCKCPEGIIGRFCQETEQDEISGPMVGSLIILGLAICFCLLWFVTRVTA